jgi:hypothetical protein
MENIEKKMQGIGYYNLRLDYLISVYRNEGRESLDNNKDKIKKLVDDYKNFEFTEGYNPSLVGIVKALILNN